MTDKEVVASAVSEENQVDVAASTSEETVQLSKAEFDKLKWKAEKYHEVAGKYYKLKDSIAQKPQEEVNIPWIDDEQKAWIEKLVERKARELNDTRERQDLVVKEEEAFLKANPTAYEKLDDIREMKRNNPKVSYSKLYKFFFDEEPEPPKEQGIKGAPPKQVYDSNDLSPNSVNDSLKKMMGK